MIMLFFDNFRVAIGRVMRVDLKILPTHWRSSSIQLDVQSDFWLTQSGLQFIQVSHPPKAHVLLVVRTRELS
jgi:hypothetical protein